MPVLRKSAYNPPFPWRNGHFSTIYMGAVKSYSTPVYKRFRLELEDGDFLLVDYQLKSPKKAVILCHGLEGDSQSGYNNRAAHYFLRHGYSVFAWNNRSCGGEMNPGIRLYHHGETEDLSRVVNAILKKGFAAVYLLGYSMGGAQIVNYLGQTEVDKRVKSAVAVSTPVSLKSSAERMERGLSNVYLKRFIDKIRVKIIEKAKRYPHILSVEKVRRIKSFEDLASEFIVPVYGFEDLNDFYQKASPKTAIKEVKTPVLILNAEDDPIIGPDSYPRREAGQNLYVYLETPKNGGHCGFPEKGKAYAYSEVRAMEFFEKQEF